jgi:glycerate 2-kinase
MTDKKTVQSIFESILEKVNPIRLMPGVLSADAEQRTIEIYGQPFNLDQRDLYIIGSGKASASMAAAAEQIAGRLLKAGMVISTPDPLHRPEKTVVLTGSHPVPDEKSEQATEELLMFIASIPENALVLNLISGGTSSLLCKPAADLTVPEISEVYRLLIGCGADIVEINSVRKALSSVKGGQLLSRLIHTELIDLIISDVPDDNPEHIGSGPTIPQSISFIQAAEILERYSLIEKIPERVRDFLGGACRFESEAGPMVTESNYPHQSFIISSARKVARHAQSVFEEKGFRTSLAVNPWSGPAEELAEHITSMIPIAGEEPSAFIFFGECTVEVRGTGKGGRNQELALRMAREIAGSERKILFMSAGTDGIDGPTDAAGAIVDNRTWNDAEAFGIDPAPYLENNDSYTFFEKAGGHIKTGPTGNNVMDLQFLIIE